MSADIFLNLKHVKSQYTSHIEGYLSLVPLYDDFVCGLHILRL